MRVKLLLSIVLSFIVSSALAQLLPSEDVPLEPLRQAIKIYQVEGMSGIINEVNECYESINKMRSSKKARDKLRCCIFLDLAGFRIEAAAARYIKFEPKDFFSSGDTFKRLLRHKNLTGFSEEMTRKFMNEMGRKIDLEYGFSTHG